MEFASSKIKTFRDLHAWQTGHDLVVTLYQATKHFPKEELFSLTNQIRRAAVSITSNIAEGFSRRSVAEKKQFYSVAMGSLTEVQNQLLIAKDVGYLSQDQFEELFQKTEQSQRLLHGLYGALKNLAAKY